MTMSSLPIVSISYVVVFISGYALRAMVSQIRRARYRRRPFVSESVDSTLVRQVTAHGRVADTAANQ